MYQQSLVVGMPLREVGATLNKALHFHSTELPRDAAVHFKQSISRSKDSEYLNPKGAIWTMYLNFFITCIHLLHVIISLLVEIAYPEF